MKKVALLLLVLVLIAACGKKAVKPQSADSKIATEAFAVAEQLKEAYLKRDITAIEKRTTKEGFKIITEEMKSFDSAELTFTPVWVNIDDDMVHLNVSWKGTWQKSGKATNERGMAVFVLTGKPLKVDSILRADPFKYPMQ